MDKKTFIYKITPAHKDFLEAADENGNNYMSLHFQYYKSCLPIKYWYWLVPARMQLSG